MKSENFSNRTTIPSGLMIVGADNQDTLNDALMAILCLAARAGNDLGICFDNYNNIVELHAGTSHQQRNIMAQRRFCEAFPGGVEHQILMVGSRSGSFNFCSDEAAGTVIQTIRKAGDSGRKSLVVFSQSIDSISSLLLADTLSQFRAECKAADVLGIAFLAHSNGFAKCELPELCEEFVEVEEVDPDFDQDVAMTFDCYSLRGMRRLGIGKTMCSLSYANRRIHHAYAPFISEEIKPRAIWYLHCAGRTNVQIAKIVGVHPSNITRQLQKLPRNAPVVMPEEWLKQTLEQLDCDDDEGGKKTPMANQKKAYHHPIDSDLSVDDLCEDDEGDEDQDEYPVSIRTKK